MVGLVGMTAIVSTAAGCGRSDDAPEADDGEAGLRGELVVYVADDFQAGSETRYALGRRSGEERPLSFDSAVGLAPGAASRSGARRWATRFA